MFNKLGRNGDNKMSNKKVHVHSGSACLSTTSTCGARYKAAYCMASTHKAALDMACTHKIMYHAHPCCDIYTQHNAQQAYTTQQTNQYVEWQTHTHTHTHAHTHKEQNNPLQASTQQSMEKIFKSIWVHSNATLRTLRQWYRMTRQRTAVAGTYTLDKNCRKGACHEGISIPSKTALNPKRDEELNCLFYHARHFHLPLHGLTFHHSPLQQFSFLL